MKPGDKVIILDSIPETKAWLFRVNWVHTEDGLAGLTCIEPGREGGGKVVPIGVLKVVEEASMTTLLPQAYQEMSLDELREAMATLQTRGVAKAPREAGKRAKKPSKLDSLIAQMKERGEESE